MGIRWVTKEEKMEHLEVEEQQQKEDDNIRVIK